MKRSGAPRTKSAIGKSNVLKGKNHERRVASLLTEWSGIEFRRRRVEGRDESTMMIDSSADVIPVNAECLFSIEAKSGSGFSMDAMMIDPVRSLFGQWWFQACYDAKLLSQVKDGMFLPLLFFKPHPNHDWIAFSIDALSHLKYMPESLVDSNICFPHLVFDEYRRLGEVTGDVSHTNVKKTVSLVMHPLIICRWKDFAKFVNPISVVWR